MKSFSTQKVVKIFTLFIFICNFAIAGSEPFLQKTKDSIVYCGLNQYLPSLEKYKNAYGKLYVNNMDNLLSKKIAESEFGDSTFEGEGFNALVRQIKDHKGFCQKDIFLNNKVSIEKYNKELKFFPYKGLTKDSSFAFNGGMYKGTIIFDNADAEMNKIRLEPEAAKKFIKKADKYSRTLVTRTTFRITGMEIDTDNYGKLNIRVMASILKVEFTDKMGYTQHTINYDTANDALSGNEIKKISYLDKYIKLDESKFTHLNRKLFGLLGYIYTTEQSDPKKLLSLTASKVSDERDPFLKKRMEKDTLPEITILDKKLRNNEMTVQFTFKIKPEYNMDREAYVFNYYGTSLGYIYKDVTQGKDYAVLGMPRSTLFAINFPPSVLVWNVPMKDAEKFNNQYREVYVTYTVKLKPKGLVGLKLSSSEREGYIRKKDPSLFKRNASLETAYENPIFIEMNIIEGTREFVGLGRHHGEENVLLKEKIELKK